MTAVTTPDRADTRANSTYSDMPQPTMTGPTNPLLEILLKSYPSAAFLPMDLSDHTSIETQIAAGNCPDLLFSHLWEQLAESERPQEAVAYLDAIIANVKAVRDAIAGDASEPEQFGRQLPTQG